MRSLHERKDCLVIGTQPPDWPANWPFPPKAGVLPPGYPRPAPAGVHLECACIGGHVVVHVVDDEYREPSDALNGQFVEITALDYSNKPARLRTSDAEPWSKRALVQIGKTNASFGVVQPFVFEAQGPVKVEVRLFS